MQEDVSTGENPEEINDQEPTGGKRDFLKALYALVDQGFVSLTNFITFVLVAKFGSRDDVNLYVLAWSIVNVARVIQERGLAAPYFVFANQSDRDRQTFLGSSLFHQSVFAVIAAFVFVVLSVVFYFRGTPVGMLGCSMMLVVSAPFVLLRDHLRAISCAHFRYGAAVFLSSLAMLLQVAIIYGAFVAERMNVVVVFGAMGISSFVPCLIWILARPQPLKFDRTRFKSDWNDTLEYSKWLVTARIFPSVAMGLVPWIVIWVLDEDAAGTWGACVTLANISNMFVFGANYFFMPKTVRALDRDGIPGLYRVLIQTAVTFTIVLSALCMFYWWFGDFVMEHIFSGAFKGNASLAAVIGLSYLIVSYSTIAGNGMTAIGKPEGLFWGELSYGMVAIAAVIVLAMQYGLMGAAIGMCLAAVAATIVETAFLVRLTASN